MSTPQTLEDVYTDELKDLWSANDQMQRVLGKIADEASDTELQGLLTRSQSRIAQHTETLKDLLEANGAEVEKEHCKGMEGLVKEATKHVLDEGPDAGPLLDVVIIAQYQRMTHYGITGFGTAAAYAKALGRAEDQRRLEDATGEIYAGDEYTTKLAETAINLRARDAG